MGYGATFGILGGHGPLAPPLNPPMVTVGAAGVSASMSQRVHADVRCIAQSFCCILSQTTQACTRFT